MSASLSSVGLIGRMCRAQQQVLGEYEDLDVEFEYEQDYEYARPLVSKFGLLVHNGSAHVWGTRMGMR